MAPKFGGKNPQILPLLVSCIPRALYQRGEKGPIDKVYFNYGNGPK